MTKIVSKTIVENKKYFWRDVTPAQVEACIKGSLLGSIYDYLQKNYTPKSPCSMILVQSLVLMACAMTHLREDLPDDDGNALETTDLEAEMQRDAFCVKKQYEATDLSPAYKSRLCIRTGTGNVPNVYALVVAPSGAGKGLGITNLAKTVGYEEVNAASIEGIRDAAMTNPCLLISLQEFGSYLAPKGGGKFKKTLTDMFSAGRFTEAFSKRSTCIRSSSWFYPSLYAAVQPEVLVNTAQAIDVSQGLLPRFLVAYVSEEEMNYDLYPCNSHLLDGFNELAKQLKWVAATRGVVEVPNPDYNKEFIHPIRAVAAPEMRPILSRYGNEYLPRIALMLSFPANYAQSDYPSTELPAPVLTQEHINRAMIILHYLFYMAERAFCGLNDLTGQERQRELDLRKLTQKIAQLHSKGRKALTVADISHVSSGTGWDSKLRIQLLNELLQRKWIRLVNTGCSISEVLRRGDRFGLLPKNVPAGIL